MALILLPFIQPSQDRFTCPEWVESLPFATTTGREVPQCLAQAAVTISDRSSILDDAMLLGV